MSKLGETIIRDFGCIFPNFKNYNGYPASICVSVNDEVVHGIPRKDHILQEGDIVSLDAGLIYKGYHSDAARTVWPVGTISTEAQRLIDVTRQSFFEGISLIQEGSHFHMIFPLPYAEICRGTWLYPSVRELVGHGIGTHLHEDPQIPNYKRRGRGLKASCLALTLAIEPMVNAGVRGSGMA